MSTLGDVKGTLMPSSRGQKKSAIVAKNEANEVPYNITPHCLNGVQHYATKRVKFFHEAPNTGSLPDRKFKYNLFREKEI